MASLNSPKEFNVNKFLDLSTEFIFISFDIILISKILFFLFISKTTLNSDSFLYSGEYIYLSNSSFVLNILTLQFNDFIKGIFFLSCSDILNFLIISSNNSFKKSYSFKFIQKFSIAKVLNLFNKSSSLDIIPKSPLVINSNSSLSNKLKYFGGCLRGLLLCIEAFFEGPVFAGVFNSGNKSNFSEFWRIFVNKYISRIGYPKLNIFFIKFLLTYINLIFIIGNIFIKFL